MPAEYTSTIYANGQTPRAKQYAGPAIVLLTMLAAIGVACSPTDEAQRHTIAFAFVVGTGAVAFGAWALSFPSVPTWARLLSVGMAIAFFVVAGVYWRAVGYDGNLYPLGPWNWPVGFRTQGMLSSEVFLSEESPRLDLPEATSQDWPQFLGPHRQGKSNAISLARDWSTQPPQLLWRRPIGEGCSSFAVIGQFAITQEQRHDLNFVVCYDAGTGQHVWSIEVGPGFFANEGNGPRSTPTIADDQVFVMSPYGRLVCIDGKTGTRNWQVDVIDQAEAEALAHGISCSPLVVGDTVVVSTGTRGQFSLVAYDRQTGVRGWVSGHDDASYSSPTLMTLCGEEQIVVLNQRSLAGHSPDDGKLLWEHFWGVGVYVVSQPVRVGLNQVLLSSGQGVGTMLFDVTCDPASHVELNPAWSHGRTLALKPKFSTPIVRDGYAYGVDDAGILVCVDLTEGKPCWKDGRFGHAQLVLIGDLFLVLAENGELVLLDLTPEHLEELGRLTLFERRTWNVPSVAGNCLFARNDRKAVCIELPLRRLAETTEQ